jgi:BirA family biotin operon repressor/biotin-[acetyl-CoA-carboxylase] ligase
VSRASAHRAVGAGAGAIAAALRRRPPASGDPEPLAWSLLWRPVCASTERELDQLLAQGRRAPLAVIARRQNRGHGQQGRVWHSPPGGVWLSAALPWGAAATGGVSQAAAGLAAPALALSLGLCLQLEGLGLSPQIKWPNDLLLHGRKLAGLLPRLRWRGERLVGCRVGVGLNGLNRVPAGAIALADAWPPFSRRCHPPAAGPPALAALVLRGLEWAVAASGQAELVRRQAERRLWRAPQWHQGESWEVAGLALDGGLRLRRGGELVELRRDF